MFLELASVFEPLRADAEPDSNPFGRMFADGAPVEYEWDPRLSPAQRKDVAERAAGAARAAAAADGAESGAVRRRAAGGEAR